MIVVALALKSLPIAATTLLLIRLMHARSAAQRSTVAHLGLLALVALPIASLALPSLALPLPGAVSRFVTAPATAVALAPALVKEALRSSRHAVQRRQHGGSTAAAVLARAPVLLLLPTLLLLGLTLAALLRLGGLRARAEVLVDSAWLGALARAQRRLGFKSGTALLRSEDLASPVSWGLLRPTILLNEAAVLAPEQAEAVIAHELAHVVHLDWIKLILGRLATALFWLNPLVWALAREAHQLREEAADDAVIAAEIPHLDYAELLVDVARHERQAVLHGVHALAAAPKHSLRRRLQRVLETDLPRSPSGRAWMTGCAFGMLAMAGPLAAFTLAPGTTALPGAATPRESADRTPLLAPWWSALQPSAAPAASLPDLPEAAGGVVAAAPAASLRDLPEAAGAVAAAPAASLRDLPRAPGGAVVAAPAASLRDLPRGARGSVAAAGGGTDVAPGRERIDADELIRMQGAGVTQAYRREMAAAGFPDLSIDELAGTRAAGISPDDARALLKLGMPPTFTDLVGARGLGLEPGYVLAMQALGITGTFAEYQTLWSLGITPDSVRGLMRQGVTVTLPRQLIELQALGAQKP